MAGEDHDSSGVVADEFSQAAANPHRCVPVVGEREDAARVLALDADQIGDAMH